MVQDVRVGAACTRRASGIARRAAVSGGKPRSVARVLLSLTVDNGLGLIVYNSVKLMMKSRGLVALDLLKHLYMRDKAAWIRQVRRCLITPNRLETTLL